MIEFDVSTPLDFNKALDKISNKNKTIYYKFLIIFINDTLFKSLRELALALNQKNFLKIKLSAHNLKSSSGYVGAGLIHYDCYYI